MENRLAISIKVRSGITQWLVLGPALLKIFINNLNSILSDYIRFRSMTEILEDTVTPQRDSAGGMSQQEAHAFNKNGCKVLHLGWNNPMH